MVVTQFGAGGSASGLGSGAGSGDTTEPIDERLSELIAIEVTRCILDATSVIFRTVKEGMMEIMEERIRAFRVEIVVCQVGARTPLFLEFMACGRQSFLGSGTPLLAETGWRISRTRSGRVLTMMRKMWVLLYVC